ncbi:hypothetical protein [Agromyces sp. PvR057]|uniref:hypothetical protein n=1 Tax=Agromyces sp. PvR057 TaxID=3156403 RepID=UPI000E38C949
MKINIRNAVVALCTAALLTGGGILAAAPAHAATRGVDVQGYCKSQFNAAWLAGASANANDAYSWRCTYAGLRLSYGIDMNAACRWTTKSGRAYAVVGDARNAYSWYCVS